MPNTSINISFTGTSSFVPSVPSQRTSIADFSNPSLRRYCYITQDSVVAVVYTASVAIPLLGVGGIYAACVSASSQLGAPPFIFVQPSNTSVTHTASAYFNVSASADSLIQYQWFSQSITQSVSGTWSPLADGGSYTGSLTYALTHSNTSVGDLTSSYFCALTDLSGVVSSSIAKLTVN